MSNTINKNLPDRTELKVLIIRKYKDQKDFCEQHSINYHTFRSFMKGRDDLTKLNETLILIMKEEYGPSIPRILPGIKIHIEAVNE